MIHIMLGFLVNYKIYRPCHYNNVACSNRKDIFQNLDHISRSHIRCMHFIVVALTCCYITHFVYDGRLLCKCWYQYFTVYCAKI